MAHSLTPIFAIPAISLCAVLSGCESTVETEAAPVVVETQQVTDAKVELPSYSEANEQAIRQSYMRNAALSAIHRTWNFYENENTPAQVLFDALEEDVVIETPAGLIEGLADFRAFVAGLTVNRANGHRLKSAELRIGDNGVVGLVAEVDYLAPGEDASTTLTPLHYSGELKVHEQGTLARISNLGITVGEPAQTQPYMNAYADNRLRGLAYHFHAMIEDPDRDPETFKEVLTDDFSISLPGLTIETEDEFAAWIDSIALTIDATEHVLDTFDFEVTGENTYTAIIHYNWRGIRRDGSGLKAKSRLEWNVVDDPAERYARIETASLEFVVPVTPISGNN